MASIAEDVNTLAGAIRRQSKMTHASVALAATSILDNELERAIKRAVRPLSKVMYGRLFDSFRPLNALSGKTVVAYAFGIISQETYTELEKIRTIRNLFAHSAELLNFESESVAPKFAALRKPPGATAKPSEVFLACVKVISDRLEAYPGHENDPNESMSNGA